MSSTRTTALILLLATAAASAMAQGGPGMGGGPGHGPGHGRWGPDMTPGWSMMTAKERDEHRERMRSMTSHEDCVAYQQQHHEQMAARAKERGGKPLAQPRHDPCAGLKK